MKLFWVYFPEARSLLSKYEVFNPKNDAAGISYDDVFVTRRFNSYIEKMSNVHDRDIIDYNEGTDLLYEAERLKEKIINFENDLWEY